MDLRVDDGAMKALVAKAIVDSLTTEGREKLISDAVSHALATPTGDAARYGEKRSPLQRAFDYAVSEEAQRYARETLANDGRFKEQIDALFAAVAKKLFEDATTREELVASIASTIKHALTKERY